MVKSMTEILSPSQEKDLFFPHAPADWSRARAEEIATAEGITLTEEHLEVVYDLQEYFFHNEGHINLRELHDALDEDFHIKGGLKRLYQIFPGGPVAQGCRLAGLEVPAYAEDKNFGTVV